MRFPFSVFIVYENSMLPTYKPGDHVLTFNWVEAKEGTPIVFEDSGRFYIKRVEKISAEQIYVVGDNKKHSKKMGPIGCKQIIGRVLWSYR